MDAIQLIKALGDAAAAAKPPQEYCLLWIDSWATCMTKAEWSGWMQAVGSVVAIWAGFRVARRSFFRQIAREELKSEELADVAAMHAYWHFPPFVATRDSTLSAVASLFHGTPEERKGRCEYLAGHFRTHLVDAHQLELLLPAKGVTHHTVQALANMKWFVFLLERWSVMDLTSDEEAGARASAALMAARVFDGLEAANNSLRAYLVERGYSLQTTSPGTPQNGMSSSMSSKPDDARGAGAGPAADER